MKASELRVGNYVEQPGRIGKICEVWQEAVKLEGYNNAYDYNHTKPIPLTEQWLLDFGFYKEGKTMLCLDLDQDNRMCFPSANTDRYIYIECNQYDYNHMDNNCCVLLTAIKHVHQLQNLYFALTGEELTLKKNMHS